MEDFKSQKGSVIKSIYFYLVSFVALMMVVFTVADIINIVLKTYIFTKANNITYYKPIECDTAERIQVEKEGVEVPKMTPEECVALEEKETARQKETQIADNQRNIVRDISMIVVGIPLFILHWRFIRKRKDEI
jgi:hypothetical protein